ncbi:hypothetical protein J7547_00070 [Wohlfahrtiimonas chitiniclastica]|uniref:Uncharacterized protein n=1 Tax=Wohlfahrtiimonas chitiniclastica TaxID=400946 RepID=A0AB35BWX8_9GAMM|nr:MULTISPECIES: hypothetical protein [Wohlfahrtiimonas]MBS7823598.1 hypothetical protein [Wohlfahrtiimonas chitiniclastica]MBS7839216.1 hypothetical protein [Wohlfahrtiimonas chitiniclastica]OYQ72888.1 hypothetical protein B9T20_08090 [Wohlfahrtiimonas sp. G9077]
MKAETIYPLAILNDQSFGIEALEEAIQAQYNEAIQTQLNRRNIEAKDRQSGFINQGVRLFNGVSGMVQAVMKTEK